MAEKYSTQICRFDAKNCFVEVLTTSLNIGKVLFRFTDYDEATHKQKNKLDLYIDTFTITGLCNSILSGKLDMEILEAEKSGYFRKQKVSPYTSYFLDMGGKNFNRNGSLDKVAFDKAKKEFPWLLEGKALSRQFKIQKSTKAKYMLRAEYGLGNVNDTGLIVPEGSAKKYIQVPITSEQADAMASGILIVTQAYYNQYYNKFSNELFPNQKVNVFKAKTQ